MKKIFGIFSAFVLLFSIFTPNFTYANIDFNELPSVLEKVIIQTEQDLGFSNLSQESDTVNNLQEIKTAELLNGSEFNVEIKKLANNNPSEITYNTDDNNIERIVITDTNTVGYSKIVSSSKSENPVYARYEGNEKTIYLYSEAKTIYLNEDSSFMFYKLKGLRLFQLDIFDISKVKNMKYMFGYYQGEETIDLRSLDFSKVEDMSFMYYGSNITSINLSGMNLNNVTTMTDFLYSANNLVSADFTNIQLNRVQDIETMFPYASPEAKLKEVKFTNAKIGNLEKIRSSLFYKLNHLEYVDFSGVDFHSLKKPGVMFNENNNLKYVNFDYADLRGLEEIGIFNNLPELTGLKFSHTILSGLQNSDQSLVHQTQKLKEIDFSYADLRNLKKLKGVFEIADNYAPNVEIFNFSNADLRSITTFQSMFSQTTTLKEVNFENARLDDLVTMEDMFKNARLPEKIKFKNNNTYNLKNMKEMFYNSYSGNFIDFSGLDLSSVETMYSMFYNAKDIKKVSFKNKNLKKLGTMEDMFYYAKNIGEVDFEGAEFENLANMRSMFQETNIKEFNFTGKNFIKPIDFGNMFFNAGNLEKVNFSNNKIDGTINMFNMFSNTTKLVEVNFKNLEAKGGSMQSAFYNCPSLERIDFSNLKFLGGGNRGTFVYQANDLKEVNFSNSKFIGNGDYRSFISGAPKLEKADFSNTVFSGGGNMGTFFYDTEKLKEVNFSGVNFIGDFVYDKMFADKPNLEKINFDKSEMNGNMNMKEMFKDSKKLEELDLSSWDTSKTINMNSMFEGTTNLKTIYVGNNFKTNNVTDSENMFLGTESIVGGNGTIYNAEKIDKEYAVIDNENKSGYFTNVLDKKYTINYVIDTQYLIGNNTNTYTQRKGIELNRATKPGYELEYWYQSGNIEPFVITESTRGDKILYPKWKSLEEKAQESDTENVTYTNETTVTIGDKIQEETINSSLIIDLVSKEVEQHEVKEEENKTKVQESEIQVTSDKIVEYQGGLEVYLEKTENDETNKIEGTAKFSEPIAVKILITSNVETVKVQVKHEGEDFGYKGLTLNPYNKCVNGEAVNDKYNGEDVTITEINGGKYALIYTCSASTFVAYTENVKPIQNITHSSSSGAGRKLQTISTTTEQEHNSADTKQEELAATTGTKTTIPTTVKIDTKLQQRTLTRGELAVMTNILLEVYPQLVEGKAELDDITNACSNYSDEQKFTKDEKKAITRLCKLSIMGIHNETKLPLEVFNVDTKSTNNEFATVINRSIETYNEKDLSVVKEALKKLENNEESVEFGTLFNVFMSIKNIFN